MPCWEWDSLGLITWRKFLLALGFVVSDRIGAVDSAWDSTTSASVNIQSLAGEFKAAYRIKQSTAETIGKVPVHCLYHRSGCTWQGPLSDCLNHCPGCPFGNSPVVCNRCGIQIVHRQVLEHAQTCPGVQAQHPAEGSQLAGVASAADQSLNSESSGNSNSQAPVSQTLMPGPVSNLKSQVLLKCQRLYYPYQAQQAQVYAQPLVPSQSHPQPQSQVQPQPQPLAHGQPPGQQQLLLQRQTHTPAFATTQPSNAQIQPTLPPPSQLPSQVQPSQLVTLSITQPDSQPAHYPSQPFMQAVAQVPPNQLSLAPMPQPAVQPMINSSLQHQPSTALRFCLRLFLQ
ncbi:hypothetical protein MLD38_009672 [Melastoma candidum]|uniref:Uncharacterized protein n=1 Tax=Melastoma candidum TaxID=119954 RepID=A0ACB9RYB8_9MYRT|nr:hypothetical protein MLD38_009672 [Melastoma candidum]